MSPGVPPWRAAAAEIAAAAAESRRGAWVRAGELRDQPLDRSAGSELHNDEGHEHDADHGRHDEKKPAQNIGSHAGTENDPLLLRFAGVSQLSAGDTTLPLKARSRYAAAGVSTLATDLRR